MGFARGDAQYEHLIGSRDEGLAFELDAFNLIGGSDAGGIEIELAAKVFGWARVSEIQPEVAEWLIGFGKQSLHLSAELIGEMIVLLFEYRGAYSGEMVLGVTVVAVARLAGP